MYDQAVELTNRIKNDKLVNYLYDWKLITFFIGGNDLCQYCKNKTISTADVYVDNIKRALDYFHEQMPRTLVNLVLTLDATGVRALNANGGPVCQSLHKTLCPCGIAKENSEELDLLVKNYQENTKELIESGRYDTKEDFTVVIQPLMEKMAPPALANGNPDYSYFSPDCFHFSSKGHAQAAIELWNNMMEPVGRKSTQWTSFDKKIKCPNEVKKCVI